MSSKELPNSQFKTVHQQQVSTSYKKAISVTSNKKILYRTLAVNHTATKNKIFHNEKVKTFNLARILQTTRAKFVGDSNKSVLPLQQQ